MSPEMRHTIRWPLVSSTANSVCGRASRTRPSAVSASRPFSGPPVMVRRLYTTARMTESKGGEGFMMEVQRMNGQDDHGVTFVTLYARIVNELAQNPRVAQESLARKLDVTMRTVQRHLTELEQEGYVRVQRDRKPYTYEIAWDKPLRYFSQLQVGMFRPDVLEELAQRSGRAG